MTDATLFEQPEKTSMNAVAKRESAEIVPADASSVMAIIDRAARDPNTDIEKLERLMGLYERMAERSAKGAYHGALAEMQPELPVIAERGEIKHGENKPVQSTYAKWEDINDAIKPILAKHRFALSFRIGEAADKVRITGVLSHAEGHSEETTIALPVDMSGSKNGVQGVGSSVSYGKRYTAQALLNLTSRGEDDDGRAAGDFPGDWITEQQLGDLVALMDEVGANRDKFLQYLRIDTLTHLPARRFKDAVAALEAKRGAR